MKRINLKNLKFKNRHEYFRSIIFDEKALAQNGAVFEVVKFPPKTKNKFHIHKSTTEIFYIQSGKGIIEIKKTKHKVQANDILLVKPNQKHRVINSSQKDLVILVFKTNSKKNDTYF